MQGTPGLQGAKGLPIDPEAVRRLSTSVDFLRARGEDMAIFFYDALFAAHPHLRPLFKTDLPSQARKLVDALVLVVENLRSPERTIPALTELGKRHTQYGARPEHYPIVTNLLIQSMAKVLGNQWTPQLHAEWTQALELVSRIMIDASSPASPSAPRPR